MEKRIYIKDWLEFKPYEKQTITDGFYLKICNDVKSAIISNNQSYIFLRFLDKKDIDNLACFLTSYFEDIISGTNIWNSFVKMHKRLYKKQLPFYNIDEYYEEEINPEDIGFLTWYFLNTMQDEKFISPLNEFILNSSEKVMDVFDNAWENAPENLYLKTFYEIDENEKDFYVARNLIDTILFKTYLFYPDTLRKITMKEFEIIEETKDKDNVLMFLNDNRDNTIHTVHTRLLSLKGKEWVAELLGKNNTLSSHFLYMSQRIQGFFFYKGQDENTIFIEHIASGKKFNLTKKSFDHSDSLTEIDTIVFMGIAEWKSEWWFSGVFFQQKFDADLILDEKNSLKSRKAVDFLDHKENDTEDMLNNQLKAFKDFNNGSQIAFMLSDSIDDFLKNYTEYFNNSLNLSAKEIEEAKQRTREEGFFGTEEQPNEFSDRPESGVVFFNPKSGVEIAFGVNSAFPLPNNTFFDIEQSENDIMFMFMSDEMSTELALFCIDNCKNDLPFFNEGGGRLYLKEIDFLLRFWKKDNYYSKPSITFTGQKDK